MGKINRFDYLLFPKIWFQEKVVQSLHLGRKILWGKSDFFTLPERTRIWATGSNSLFKS